MFLNHWLKKKKEMRLAALKADALIKMNRADRASKNDIGAVKSACEAVLRALRAGVILNPKNRLFKRFLERRWDTEMMAVCDTMKNPMTKLGHFAFWSVLATAGAFVGGPWGVVVGLGGSAGLSFGFEKLKAIPKQYNRGLYAVFYDDIKRRKSTTQELQEKEQQSAPMKELTKEKTVNSKKDLEKLAALGQIIERGRRALKYRPVRSRAHRLMARFLGRSGHDAA